MPPEPEPAAPELRPLWRRLAVLGAVLRYAIPLAAVPLMPVLIPDRVALLVLLRPTKDLLLLGGGQLRVLGEPSVLLLFAAYVPLMVLGVWVFFVVGRAYGPALRAGEAPAWLQRALPARHLDVAERVLAVHGPTIAVLGRIAALPPTALAAAAGLSSVSARRYLAADLLGATAAFAITVGAGYALGRAYEAAGLWVALGGGAMFLALLVLLTRWIRNEAAAHPEVASEPAG